VCRVDDLSVVKCLVQLTLTVARHHSSAVELCRDVARDLHICVGDIDQVSHTTCSIAAAAAAAIVLQCLTLLVGSSDP